MLSNLELKCSIEVYIYRYTIVNYSFFHSQNYMTSIFTVINSTCDKADTTLSFMSSFNSTAKGLINQMCGYCKISYSDDYIVGKLALSLKYESISLKNVGQL